MTPFSSRVERRIWWSTVSNAADRSRSIRTEEREFALAAWSDSVTARRAVSVEWPGLNPDWWGSRRLFCWRYKESWLKRARSSIFDRKDRRDTGL